MQRIYIVEDDDSIRKMVCYALETAGFAVSDFADSAAFWQEIKTLPLPALLILDIMLPGEDGLMILKRWRALGYTTPVIMLTAKGGEMDRVKGLELGADDYITKPFSVMEFIARVKTILRRCASSSEDVLRIADIVLRLEQRSVTVQEQAVTLTYTEFELLRSLMQNAGIVLTRDRLIERIWGIDADLESRTVDMHIASLRHKLGTSGTLIQTVRSVGYKMEANT